MYDKRTCTGLYRHQLHSPWTTQQPVVFFFSLKIHEGRWESLKATIILNVWLLLAELISSFGHEKTLSVCHQDFARFLS